MSLSDERKINRLLKNWPLGAVYLTSWLNQEGFSNQLLNRYKKSHWLESIGTGALIRAGDTVGYEGAIHALQKAGSTVHPGGKTALALLGKVHYLDFTSKNAILFGKATEKLPTWCRNYDWSTKLHYYPTSFLASEQGLIEFEVKTFSIKISSPARAMMECLYLAPEKQPLLECYELMEGLNSLRPSLVQELLEACNSVKVKRLFLYLAEKAGHDWVLQINRNTIDLGKGKRSLVKHGVYIPAYQLVVPKELDIHAEQGL